MVLMVLCLKGPCRPPLAKGLAPCLHRALCSPKTTLMVRHPRGRRVQGRRLGVQSWPVQATSVSGIFEAATALEAEGAQAGVAGSLDKELRELQKPASVWLPGPNIESLRRSEVRRRNLSLSLPTKVVQALMRLMAAPADLANAIGFRLQVALMGSVASKLLMFFAVGIPLCLLGGGLYSLASGRSIAQGVVNAYGALYKVPGITVLGEANVMTVQVMNFLWMVGTFLFGAVIAIITQDIIERAEAIRSGIFPVVAANHTLILGWSSEILPLLRQIAIHRAEAQASAFDGPIVVLAERAKLQMDSEVAEGVRGLGLEVHTRSGSPHSLGDLQHVAAGLAKNLLILNPDAADGHDAGERQVATLLGLQAARASLRPGPWRRLSTQTITVQAPDEVGERGLVRAATTALNATSQVMHLADFSARQNMSMLLAHSAVQPGLASVVSTFLQQSSNTPEFYIRSFPDLSGKTFREARQSFSQAVVCGYMRAKDASRHMRLNPLDDDVIAEGDRLIALAPSGHFEPDTGRGGGEGGTRADMQPSQPARPIGNGVNGKDVVSHGILGSDSASNGFSTNGMNGPGGEEEDVPHHVVVAWWPEKDIRELREGLSKWLPHGSHVTIVCPFEPLGWQMEGKEDDEVDGEERGEGIRSPGTGHNGTSGRGPPFPGDSKPSRAGTRPLPHHWRPPREKQRRGRHHPQRHAACPGHPDLSRGGAVGPPPCCGNGERGANSRRGQPHAETAWARPPHSRAAAAR
eukprot:jgi/Botrbrau1/3662/Bobra.0204s0052.1